MENQFVKRLKSFVWRAGIVGGLAFIEAAMANINVLDAPNWLVVLIGLGLSEVTKWLNTQKQVAQ